MQKLFAILLVLSLGFHSLMKLGIVAWYELNKDYVEDVLCINNDKPELNCHGKCYLNKQLEKVDNADGTTDKDYPATTQKTEIVEYTVAPGWQMSPKYIRDLSVVHYAHYLSAEGLTLVREILRPPSV